MSVTRREFLVAAVALVPVVANPRSPQSPGGWEGASVAHAPSVQGASNPPVTRNPPVAGNAPVVSFHLDQPYLDLTGLEKPYVPPVGMRSGASLAALGQEEVLSRFYGFI